MAKESKRVVKQNNGEDARNQYFNLDAEKAFFDEVDEEVRNERFKELMNKYSGVILAVLVVVLSFAVGYEKIGAWRLNKAEQKSMQYIQAASTTPNYEDNIAALENIVATETGLYRDISHLQIANILLDNNQTEKALEVLETIHKSNNVNSKIREIVAIKLATYKIDTAKYQEIEQLLVPVIQANGAWAAMAKELLAMSAIQNKDMAKAKVLYQELLTNGNISDDFKLRINDMLASISEVQ